MILFPIVKVLDCLLECRNKPPVDRSKRGAAGGESGNRSGRQLFIEMCIKI